MLRHGQWAPMGNVYKWWEDEAIAVLWGFQALEIRLVIHYGLFDEDLPQTVLFSRDVSAVNDILNALAEPSERASFIHLPRKAKIEEILRRCSHEVTPQKNCSHEVTPQKNWNWIPSATSTPMNAEKIAQRIDFESHLLLREVTFEDIVRESLGYSAPSVKCFLEQHQTFYNSLLSHLNSHREDVPIYKDVEKYLRSRSPFAHQAVSQCLGNLLSEAAPSKLQSFTSGFHFVTRPLHCFFKDRPESLTDMLKLCNIFAVRFRRQYINAAKVPWSKPIDISYPFFENWITSSSPVDFARTLTALDKASFGEFHLRNNLTLDENDESVQRLRSGWNALVESVWECCAAIPNMSAHLLECAQDLNSQNNYHSLTAVLYGIRGCAVAEDREPGSVITPELDLLIDETDNYANYRQRYHEAPGLPFLIPHLRDRQQIGEIALHSEVGFLQK